MENQLPTQQQSNKKSIFDRLVSPALYYIGMIGAVLMCIAYIAVVIVLIVGFEQRELKGCIIFALVNAIVGLIIMQFLKLQGTIFAKNLPQNKVILEEYYSLKTKDKKIRSIKFYWTTSLIKDIIFKGVSFAASTIGIIYIVIKGSNDYALLLLALVNLIMFICFGIVALNSAFEFFNNRHIVYIKSKIEEVKKENKDELSISRNIRKDNGQSKSSGVQQKKKCGTRRKNSNTQSKRKCSNVSKSSRISS